MIASLASGLSARGATAVERHVAEAAEQAMAIARADGPPSRMMRRFQSLLNRYADMDAVADLSLGPYRDDMPEAYRPEFDDLVARFAASMFASYAADFAGRRVDITGVRQRSDSEYVVSTRIVFGDGRPPSEIDWRVTQRRGQFTVRDIRVRGIWLVLSVRSHFVGLVNQNNGSINSLMYYLRQSVGG